MRVVNPGSRDEQGPTEPPRPSFRLRLSTMALAATFLLSTGTACTLGAYLWTHHTAAGPAQPNAAALALSRLGKDVAELKTSVESTRQDDTVRALKKSVDQLKAELDGLRTANTVAIAQINTKLDKPAATPQPALADVAARLEKLDHDPRLGDITARLDRIERQVSASPPTGSITPVSRVSAAQTVVSQTVAPPKSNERVAVLDNWIVRDVYSGVALVEGRSGGVREVVPGEVLPGAGEVRSIERHGRGWVVVTSRGIIDTETW